jgi:hypothetical protein
VIGECYLVFGYLEIHKSKDASWFLREIWKRLLSFGYLKKHWPLASFLKAHPMNSTPKSRNRPRVQRSSSDNRPSKRKRGAYKYGYVESKSRRGKEEWKEVDASFKYEDSDEDSDSEVRLPSPSKAKCDQNFKSTFHVPVEDHSLQYNQDDHGDSSAGHILPAKRKMKVSARVIGRIN